GIVRPTKASSPSPCSCSIALNDSASQASTKLAPASISRSSLRSPDRISAWSSARSIFIAQARNRHLAYLPRKLRDDRPQSRRGNGLVQEHVACCLRHLH